jgi:hypothetical protein
MIWSLADGVDCRFPLGALEGIISRMNSIPLIDVLMRAEQALTQSKEVIRRYRKLQRELVDIYIEGEELRPSYKRSAFDAREELGD